MEVLRAYVYREDQLHSLSMMAAVLNRIGFRRCTVVKAKLQKNIKETDAIFDTFEKG